MRFRVVLQVSNLRDHRALFFRKSTTLLLAFSRELQVRKENRKLCLLINNNHKFSHICIVWALRFLTMFDPAASIFYTLCTRDTQLPIESAHEKKPIGWPFVRLSAALSNAPESRRCPRAFAKWIKQEAAKDYSQLYIRGRCSLRSTRYHYWVACAQRRGFAPARWKHISWWCIFYALQIALYPTRVAYRCWWRPIRAQRGVVRLDIIGWNSTTFTVEGRYAKIEKP